MKKFKFISIIICLALLSTILIGCGSSKSYEEAENTNNEKNETTKNDNKKNNKNDKILQLSTLSDADDDKITTPWRNNSLQASLMFRRLFLATYNSDDIQEDLASKYEVSEDGLTYKLYLKNAKWSDGEDITIDDVIFSIKTVLLASQANGIYTSAFKKIEGYDEYIKDNSLGLSGLTADGNVLTIKLSSPHSILIPVLAQFTILPEHILKDADPLTLHQNSFWSNPVTSGAYKLKEFSIGNYYTLEPNEYYDGIKPKIENVIVYIISDYVTAVEAGKIDFISTNVPAEIDKLTEMKNMEKFPIDMLFYRYLIANISGKDGNINQNMQDPKIREAILYAIDRETLAKSIYPELATVINSGVLSSDSANNGIKFEYNPEKAKKLLKESSYDFSKKLRLTYYYKDQTSIDFMEAIAYYLGEVGFNVELFYAANGSTDLYQTRNYDLALKGLGAFDISEWYGEYSSTNPFFQNIFGGKGEFDNLITALGSERDKDKTTEILKNLQALEQKLLYKIPLFTVGQVAFLNKDKVSIPNNITFGNSRYKYDIDFEKWELK